MLTGGDYGPLKIPKVLVELQKALLAVRGLDVEGIFSVKGNDRRMHEIEEQLTAETFPEKEDYSTYDPHDVASTIKAWFGRLPTPVLSKLDDDLAPSTKRSASEREREMKYYKRGATRENGWQREIGERETCSKKNGFSPKRRVPSLCRRLGSCGVARLLLNSGARVSLRFGRRHIGSDLFLFRSNR